MFVNHSSVPDLTSPGFLQVNTIGQPADGAIIGYLWVKYTVRLGVPRNNPTSVFSTRHYFTTMNYASWNDYKSSPNAPVSRTTYGWPVVGSVAAITDGLRFTLPHDGIYDVNLLIINTTGASVGSGMPVLSLTGAGIMSTTSPTWASGNYKLHTSPDTVWIQHNSLKVDSENADSIIPAFNVTFPSTAPETGNIMIRIDVHALGSASTTWNPLQTKPDAHTEAENSIQQQINQLKAMFFSAGSSSSSSSSKRAVEEIEDDETYDTGESANNRKLTVQTSSRSGSQKK